ncbi:MAG: type I restriction endonuclease subunit R, partial [Lactococcus sp.]|nr:type I restriction endonuclease subunit R [Lactococcus sp.]
YDDFTGLQALQLIDVNDVDALEKLKEKFYLDDEKINEFSELEVPSLRQVQDYRSTYNDIRDWYNNEYHNLNDAASTFDWGSVTFEVELLKSQEINLDYILELIFETNKKVDDKELLVEEITRTIRSSGNRAKETLIVAFIHETNLDEIKDKAQIVDQFMIFARKSRTKEVSQLIAEEGLNEASAKRYIKLSLQREYASENGSDLMDTLPKMSPLNPAYLKKKQVVFQKMSELVEKFKGVGGTID